jgi:hypothetical protein
LDGAVDGRTDAAWDLPADGTTDALPDGDATADLASDAGADGPADAEAPADLATDGAPEAPDGAGAGAAGAGGGGAAGAAAGAGGGTGGASGRGGAGGSGGGGSAGAGGGSVSPKLYAILDGGSSEPTTLEIVDATTWTLIRNVSLGGTWPGNFDVDPSGQRIFIAGPVVDDSNFHALSTTTGTELSGPRPAGSFGVFTVSPNGATIFALGYGASDPSTGRSPVVVTAIDIATLTISDSLSMADGTIYDATLPISADGAKLALLWLPAPQFQIEGLRILHTAGGLGVDSTAAFSDSLLDWKSPTFTADGQVLLWEENYMYISVAGQMPYLNPHPGYLHPGACVDRCLAYDPIAQTGMARGNFWLS